MPGTTIRICDETPFGVGWIASEPAMLERASHALAEGGRYWLVDPVAGPEIDERLAGLGEPAGILQLVDRHDRDCAALAERLRAPHLDVPFAGVPDSPFSVWTVVRFPGWHEVALWWEAERVLVCADALGTVPYFRAEDEPLAVHPFFRLYQPRGLRDLAAALSPEHILVGHGEGIHGLDAPDVLARAVRRARRSAPAWISSQLRRKEKR